jgi:hypothetical protein
MSSVSPISAPAASDLSLTGCAAPRLSRFGVGRDWLAGAATLTLAGIFAYAGVEKLHAPSEFASAIANYRLPLFPAPAIHATATILPVLEVVLAAALLAAVAFLWRTQKNIAPNSTTQK